MSNTVWLTRNSYLNPLHFCLWGWMKSEIYKRKVDTGDELIAGILDTAANKNKREDQLWRKTRDLRTRVAKCIKVYGGILEHFLWTVRNLSFLYIQFVI